MISTLFQAPTLDASDEISTSDFQKLLKQLQDIETPNLPLEEHEPDKPQEILEYNYFSSNVNFPLIIKNKFFSNNMRAAALLLINNAIILITETKEMFFQPPPTSQEPIQIIPQLYRKPKKELEKLFALEIEREIALLKLSDRGDVFVIDDSNKCWFYSVSAAIQEFESMNYEFIENNDIFMTSQDKEQYISASFIAKDEFINGKNDLMICFSEFCQESVKCQFLNVEFDQEAIITKKCEKTFSFNDELIEECVTSLSPLGELVLLLNNRLCIYSVDFDNQQHEELKYEDIATYLNADLKILRPKRIIFSTDSVFVALLYESAFFITTTINYNGFEKLIKTENFNNLEVDGLFLNEKCFSIRINTTIIQYLINTENNEEIAMQDRFYYKTMIVNCCEYFLQLLLELIQESIGENSQIDELICEYLNFLDSCKIDILEITVPSLLLENSDPFMESTQYLMKLSKEDEVIANLVENSLVAMSGYLLSLIALHNSEFKAGSLLFVKNLKKGFVSSYLVCKVLNDTEKIVNEEYNKEYFIRLLGKYNISTLNKYEFKQLFLYAIELQAVCNEVLTPQNQLLVCVLAILSVYLDIVGKDDEMLSYYTNLAQLLGYSELCDKELPRLPAFLMLLEDNSIVFESSSQIIFYSIDVSAFEQDLFEKYNYIVKFRNPLKNEYLNCKVPEISDVNEFKQFIDENLNEEMTDVYIACENFYNSHTIIDLKCPLEPLEEILLLSEKCEYYIKEKCLFSGLEELIAELSLEYQILFSSFGIALLLHSSLQQIVFSAELLVQNGHLMHAIDYLKHYGTHLENIKDKETINHLITCILKNSDLLREQKINSSDELLENELSQIGLSEAEISAKAERGYVPEFKIEEVKDDKEKLIAELENTVEVQTGMIINPLKGIMPKKAMTFEHISLEEIMKEQPEKVSNAVINLKSITPEQPEVTYPENYAPSSNSFNQNIYNQPLHRQIPIINKAESQPHYEEIPENYQEFRYISRPEYYEPVSARTPDYLPVFINEEEEQNAVEELTNPLSQQQSQQSYQELEEQAIEENTVLPNNENTNFQIPVCQNAVAPPIVPIPLSNEEEVSSPQIPIEEVVVKRVKSSTEMVENSSNLSLDSDLFVGPKIKTNKEKENKKNVEKLDYEHIQEVLEDLKKPEEEAVEAHTIQQPEIDTLKNLLSSQQPQLPEPEIVEHPVNEPPVIQGINMGGTIYAETDIIKPRDESKYVPAPPNFDLSEHYKELEEAAKYAATLRKAEEPQITVPNPQSSYTPEDFSNLSEALKQIDKL